MSSKLFDIVAINETKLDDSISDMQVSVDGHAIIRIYRFRGAGGVAMYVQETLNYREREDLCPHDLELVALEMLKNNSKPFLVSTWYRPPCHLVY
jgi:exonuclease III